MMTCTNSYTWRLMAWLGYQLEFAASKLSCRWTSDVLAVVEVANWPAARYIDADVNVYKVMKMM